MDTQPSEQKVVAGIFAKHVLFVPTHDAETGHWWLALIVHPWAAASSGLSQDCKPFIAFLDSIDPRLCSGMSVEDVQVAAQAAAAAEPRHQKALELLRDYLKKEWSACFGSAAEFCPENIPGISLTVPQQTNGTDCGVFVLEFARRLLDDPAALDYLCAYQASPPQLSAPPSGNLRRRWRKLGQKLAADANARPIATPARAKEEVKQPCRETEKHETGRQRKLRRAESSESEAPDIQLLDSHLQRLASGSSCADRAFAFDSRLHNLLLEGKWSEVKTLTSALRQDMAEGIFSRDVIMVPLHDAGHTWLALIVQPWAAANVSESVLESLPGLEAFVAWLDPCARKASQDVRRRALKLLQDFLKREWTECFGLASDYQEARIKEVLLQVPEGKRSGASILELVNRLLESPRLLDHLCSSQESPLELLAPLARKWRKL
ncbi:unnamed protein product [Effrenium voratum]|uniref:Ubiquitin-like protease family profile domain-containing protein n=1 Tax=Effrenium voratum TaxID=2562239 RepID=A0AA36I043_9DINO|nr:unnamed protein product [Effrenium voratum]